MTAFIVIGFIVMFFLLVLFSSIHVTVVYEDVIGIKIRFWFLLFKFPKYKEKHLEEKKEKKSVEEEKKSGALDIIKKKGIKQIAQFVKTITFSIFRAVKKMLSHFIVDRFDCSVLVVGSDAADTAIKYGYLCAACYPILGRLKTSSFCKKQSFRLAPGFCAEKSMVRCNIKFHIKIIYLLSAVFLVALDLIKCLIVQKKAEKK